MSWAGWGAGPAGAGAAGGPSRWFLGVALVGCAVVTAILAARGRWLPAGVGIVISAYFFARLFLGLGRPRDERGS